MSAAALALGCRCGALLILPCPTLADMHKARNDAADAGWGYLGGFAACPACLDAGTFAPPPAPLPPPQRDLFVEPRP
jgi:hypothetical protein